MSAETNEGELPLPDPIVKTENESLAEDTSTSGSPSLTLDEQNSSIVNMDLIGDIINESISSDHSKVEPTNEEGEEVDQGSEAVDEDSSSMPIPDSSSQSVPPSANPKCPDCGADGDQVQYKKSSFKPKNKLQVCWIYRTKCTNASCGSWFGPLKRFDRGTFINVDELGRPVGRMKIIEKRASEEQIEEEKLEDAPAPRKEEEEDDDEEEELCLGRSFSTNSTKSTPTKQKKKTKKKRPLLTSIKHRTSKKRDPAAAELRSIQNAKYREKKKKEQEEAAREALKNKRPTRERSTRTEHKKPEPKKPEPKKQEPKQERKKKSSSGPHVAEKPSDIVMVQQDVSMLIGKNGSKFTTSSMQTEHSLLVDSNLMEEIFYQQMAKKLEPPIAARLMDQPKIVVVKFVTMAKVIETQAARIKELEVRLITEGKMHAKVKDYISETKLLVMDTLRNSKSDVQDLTKEFRTFHLESLSIQRRLNAKMQKLKDDAAQKFDDYELKIKHMQAQLDFKEKQLNYERARIEHVIFKQEKIERARYKAEEIARDAKEKLDNTLYLTGNQTCPRCRVKQKVRQDIVQEVSDMTIERDKALQENKELTSKLSKMERCAQILGQDLDKVNYENRTWKAMIEKLKADIAKLNEQAKEYKANARNSSNASITPKLLDTPAATPRTTISTPMSSGTEPEKVSPPEEGELVDSPPPDCSSGAKDETERKKEGSVPKEPEKSKTPPPIAAGFASWVPKERLNAPAPEIPRALDPFGVPIRLKAAQPAENKLNLPPSHLPLPWDKPLVNPSPSGNVSSSLAAVAARVEAEAFLGTMPISTGNRGRSPNSRVAQIQGQHQNQHQNHQNHQNRGNQHNQGQMKKRYTPSNDHDEASGSDSPSANKKKKKNESPRPNQNSHQKQKFNDFTTSSPSSSASPSCSSYGGGTNSGTNSSTNSKSQYGGSLTNMSKIPRRSDKPPQPEFAKALGVRDEEGYKDIPGLSLLNNSSNSDGKGDSSEKEKADDERKKIKEAEVEKEKAVKEKPTPKPQIVPRSNSPPWSSSRNNQKPATSNIPNTIAAAEPVPNRNNSRQSTSTVNISPFGVRSSSPIPPQRRMVQQPTIRAFNDIPPRTDRYASWTDSSSPSPSQRSSSAFESGSDSFSALPWHRDAQQGTARQQTHYDTPFGKVPIREDAWGRIASPPNTHPPHHQPTPPARPTYNYFGSPLDRPPANRNPPERRPFWD